MGIDWKIHFFDSTGFKYLNELTNCFCDTVTHSERQESHLMAKEDDDTNVDDDPKKHTKTKENAFTRLDGNDLLHATFTRPDWRTPPTKQHRACATLAAAAAAVSRNAPFYEYISLSLFSFWILFIFFLFSFSFFFFFFSFFHSLTFPNVNTPWSDATTPASSLYSLSSLFRINIRKGERKRKNRMRRVKRERKNSPPPPHTPMRTRHQVGAAAPSQQRKRKKKKEEERG